MQSELDALKSKLKSSPELVKVPQQLSDLSNSVAQFGSQIKDLEATVGSLKDQGSKLQTASDTLQSNITAIQVNIFYSARSFYTTMSCFFLFNFEYQYFNINFIIPFLYNFKLLIIIMQKIISD